MKDVEVKIGELLNDRERIESLLLLEKVRRGVRKDDLLFIGISYIADYCWCAMQAVLKNKSQELLSFDAYLNDRIQYALRLGHIDKLPDTQEVLLEVGGEITFDDVQKLLMEETERWRRERAGSYLAATEFADEHGAPVMVINPDLSLEEMVWYE